MQLRFGFSYNSIYVTIPFCRSPKICRYKELINPQKKIKEKDKKYVLEKGVATIKSHAYDFIRKRLAPRVILNDGKQTPMRGHPVFISQHATATCCRGCLSKWHKIPSGRDLTEQEIDYVVSVIMAWIYKEMEK